MNITLALDKELETQRDISKQAIRDISVNTALVNLAIERRDEADALIIKIKRILDELHS